MSKNKLLTCKIAKFREVDSRYTTAGKILLQDTDFKNNLIVVIKTIQNYHHHFFKVEEERHKNGH